MAPKAHFFLSLILLYLVLSTTTTAGVGGRSAAPPAMPPAMTPRCPRDALKLGVCANLLGSLVGAEAIKPPTTPCCSLLSGLLELEVAVCLCTAIRANVLGVNLNVPLSLNLLLNACGGGTTPPSGFTC